MRIPQLPELSAPTSSHLFAVSSSTNDYKIDYNKLAKALIEQYAGSSLGGSARSIKAAIDNAYETMAYSRDQLSLISGVVTGNTTVTAYAIRFGRLVVLQYNFNGTPSSSDSDNHKIFSLPTASSALLNVNTIKVAQNGNPYILQVSGADVNINFLGKTYSGVTFFRDSLVYTV